MLLQTAWLFCVQEMRHSTDFMISDVKLRFSEFTKNLTKLPSFLRYMYNSMKETLNFVNYPKNNKPFDSKCREIVKLLFFFFLSEQFV